MINPHFDENKVLWDDKYSGKYYPPDNGYEEQFDLQWKIALDQSEYFNNTGASTDDIYIKERVYEWTGAYPSELVKKEVETCRALDHPIDINLIKNKNCIDIGCGMGRWTRTMQMIGAKSVLSVDISESGLKNVSKFNNNILRANIMELSKEHPELKEQFDFACFWGVAMCTNDPLKAFLNAALTVKPGGALYLMVYADTGMHGYPIVNIQRKKFYQLKDVESRLKYVDKIYNRKWDKEYPLKYNIENMLSNILRKPKGGIGKIGVLDMLEPYYNWVISLNTIYKWMNEAGFTKITYLNEFEKSKCAYHFLGQKL